MSGPAQEPALKQEEPIGVGVSAADARALDDFVTAAVAHISSDIAPHDEIIVCTLTFKQACDFRSLGREVLKLRRAHRMNEAWNAQARPVPPAAAPVGELRERLAEITKRWRERAEGMWNAYGTALRDMADTVDAALAAAPVTGDRETAGVELATILRAFADAYPGSRDASERGDFDAFERGYKAALATPPSGGGDHAGGRASPARAGSDAEAVFLARAEANLLRHGGVGENARMPTKPERQAAKVIDDLADRLTRATAAPATGVEERPWDDLPYGAALARWVMQDYEASGLHPDTCRLVRSFAGMLAYKLREAEKKYGHTNEWLTEDWEERCASELRRHVEKGDPVDVAAYAAFAWSRKYDLAASPKAQGSEVGLIRAVEIALSEAKRVIHSMPRDDTRKVLFELWSAVTDLAASRTGQKGAGE